MSSHLDVNRDREFHGQVYKIQITSSGDSLSIQLDQELECGNWKCSFSQSYIEDLTQKTGFKRKFSDFCLILAQAVKQEKQGTINLDILTYQDLENMKAKKSGQQAPRPDQLNQAQVKANKRYIILSVSNTTSSDKIHYPLTLNFEEVEDVDRLKMTVQKLKKELDDVRSSRDNLSGVHSESAGNVQKKDSSFFITENMDKKLMNSTNSSIQSHASESVLQENELLKTKIKRLEESFQQKRGALEVDNIMQKKLDLEIELDSVKIQSRREIERLQMSMDERDMELNMKRTEVRKLREDLTSNLSGDEGVKKLKDHILSLTEQSEKELISSRKTIHHLQKENEKSSTDMDFFKRNDQKQKNRIRQLEIELETATKRGSARGVNDRLYSPYNKNATGSTGAAGRRANSVPVKSYSPANRFANKNAAQKPGGATGGYQRNNSNENAKNRMSPSYNYGYKKNGPAQSATNTRNTGAGGATNSNATGARGSYGQNRTNNYSGAARTSNSPGGYQRYGQNKTTTGAANNNRVSPGTNNNRVSPGTNANNRVSPGTNANRTNAQRVSPANNRVSPGARNPPLNTGINRNNSNSRVSPANRNNAQRTNQVGGVKNNSPGARYSNQSPGTRYNNYMNQKKPGQGPINAKQVPTEFNDKHLKPSVPNQNKDLDNRLDRLQNLLNKAKK